MERGIASKVIFWNATESQRLSAHRRAKPFIISLMQMKIEQFPQRWKDRVEIYLEENSKYKQISISDFQHNLKLIFDDGSNAYFRYAFYLIDDENKEIAVFTEHCGYHIFPLLAVKIETYNQNKEIIKTEDFRIE